MLLQSVECMIYVCNSQSGASDVTTKCFCGFLAYYTTDENAPLLGERRRRYEGLLHVPSHISVSDKTSLFCNLANNGYFILGQFNIRGAHIFLQILERLAHVDQDIYGALPSLSSFQE